MLCNIKLLIFFMTLCLLFPLKGYAQARDLCVMLHVEDVSTKRPIGHASAYVFSKKEEGADSLMVIKIMKETPEYLYYGEMSRDVSVGDTLYVCTQCELYEEKITPFVITAEMVRNEPVEIEGTVSLKRKAKVLSEATVTASKVMLVNKGDTIVYNADYFQLAEGSMLDELVSRLPGVKLESGGRITVNGNFVSSLLINGKDFFRGDVSVAMENLPAYMVNKVKVYQKTPDNAYITRDSCKAQVSDPWVIDVNLKRDYAQGWTANAEAGYGTEERYQARLFGLRFNDISWLSLFANLNNTNDNSRPGREGTWSSFEPVVGLSETKQEGLSYGVESNSHKTKFSTNLVVTHSKDKVHTETMSEKFLEYSASYVCSRHKENLKNGTLNWDASLSHAARKVFFSWDNYLHYSKSEDAAGRWSAERAALPAENYRGALLDSLFVFQNYGGANGLTNYLQDFSAQDATSWSYMSLFNTDISLPHSHYISLQLNGRYAHTSNSLFSQYALFTPQASEREDFLNRYYRSPRHEYQWWTYANAPFYENGTVKLVAAYTYRQEYYTDSRNLYRLDSLGGEWATAGGRPLGVLPSTADSLTRCVDYANTYNTNRHLYRHTPELQVQFFFKNGGSLSLFLPVNFEHDMLGDLRQKDVRSRVSRHYVGFEPRMLLGWGGLNVEARKQLVVPTMTYLLDVRDDSNPLAVYLGNPLLKASDIYSLSAQYSKSVTKYAQNYHAGAAYRAVHQAVGQSRSYDSTTGVTTYTPRNMNGNWTLNVNGGYARSLDLKQRWTVATDATWRYEHSVDFLQTDSHSDAASRSVVRNHALDGNFALRYNRNPLALSFVASAKWQHAESARVGFATVNTLDMLYGVTAHVALPWGMDFSTDCTLCTRGGYSDESMNTHEWIWNAACSKSFLKKKNLIIRIYGYDMLRQRHHVVRTLNAQGHTETWYNTLPRYLMLTLTYRLNIQPSKRTA